MEKDKEGGTGFLTASEVAKYLNCSKPWVYRAAESRELKHYRLGDLLRFKIEDINLYLEKSKVS